MRMADSVAGDRDRDGEEYHQTDLEPQTNLEDQTPVGHELEVDVSVYSDLNNELRIDRHIVFFRHL